MTLNYSESIPMIMDHEAMRVVLDRIGMRRVNRYSGAMGIVINIIRSDDTAAKEIVNSSVLQSLKDMLDSRLLSDSDIESALLAVDAIFNNAQIDLKLIQSSDIIPIIVQSAKKSDNDQLKIRALECLSSTINRSYDNEYICYIKNSIKVEDIIEMSNSEMIKSQIDLKLKLDASIERIF